MANLIKILILTAHPDDQQSGAYDGLLRGIRESFERAKNRKRIQIEERHDIRTADIRRALLEVQPQIVHFCSSRSEQGIMVGDDRGGVMPLSAQALGELFGLFREKIECVILHGCYLEDQVIHICRYIDWVVGIRTRPSTVLAEEYVRGFYDALGAGKDIEFAHQLGNNAVATEDKNAPEIAILNQMSDFPAQARSPERQTSNRIYSANRLPYLCDCEDAEIAFELTLSTYSRSPDRSLVSIICGNENDAPERVTERLIEQVLPKYIEMPGKQVRALSWLSMRNVRTDNPEPVLRELALQVCGNRSAGLAAVQERMTMIPYVFTVDYNTAIWGQSNGEDLLAFLKFWDSWPSHAGQMPFVFLRVSFSRAKKGMGSWRRRRQNKRFKKFLEDNCRPKGTHKYGVMVELEPIRRESARFWYQDEAVVSVVGEAGARQLERAVDQIFQPDDRRIPLRIFAERMEATLAGLL